MKSIWKMPQAAGHGEKKTGGGGYIAAQLSFCF
jgi:hypothetical protein